MAADGPAVPIPRPPPPSEFIGLYTARYDALYSCPTSGTWRYTLKLSQDFGCLEGRVCEALCDNLRGRRGVVGA